MQRRTFLKMTVGAPLIGISLPIREVREGITIGDDISAHMIVTAHFSNQEAEAHRKEWIGRPFEGEGEWYLDTTETRELPPHLAEMPGTLTYHTSTVGVAAQRVEHLVGAFRREHISIIVRMTGDHEQTMLAIGEHIAAQRMPSRFETGWNPTHLQKFLPDENDLGMPVEESDAFWP